MKQPALLDWLKKIWEERKVIRLAPMHFTIAVFSSAIVIGGAMWFFLSDRFETRIGNMESALKAKDAQIDLLKTSIDLKKRANKDISLYPDL
jgi:hypothetical protein